MSVSKLLTTLQQLWTQSYEAETVSFETCGQLLVERSLVRGRLHLRDSPSRHQSIASLYSTPLFPSVQIINSTIRLLHAQSHLVLYMSLGRLRVHIVSH